MTLKRTYALPVETVEQFERMAPPGKRSAMLAAIMADWVDRKRREELSRDIINGCREMAEIYLATEQEYHALEEEVEHGARKKSDDRRTKKGKRRSRPARSH